MTEKQVEEKMIQLEINDQEFSVHEGRTLLEACREHGIYIPTLCYLPEAIATGCCRVCVVEVEGSRTLVGSCHTPIAPGMVIQTHSPRVLEARRVLVELMMASHPDTCIVCEAANCCELRLKTTDLDIGMPRFRARKHYSPVEEESPYVVRDMSKCIICRRCAQLFKTVSSACFFRIHISGGIKILNLRRKVNIQWCRIK